MLNLLYLFLCGTFGSSHSETTLSATASHENALLLQLSSESVTEHNQLADSRSLAAYYEELWDGMEAESAQVLLEMHLDSNASSTFRNSFKVLGLVNTGTNLLERLLKLNFDGWEVQPNKPTGKPQPLKQCNLWKHSSLRILKEKEREVLSYCQNNVVGLAMIRNPLSWLDSFSRAPYDLKKCSTGKAWYSRKCTFPASMTRDTYLASKTYKNLETIWQMWNTDYEALQSYGFSKSLLIRYEDLVEDTEGTLAKIASVAGLSIPKSIKQEVRNMSPQDQQHRPDGRRNALEKLRTKSYLHTFKHRELRDICKLLDKNLMHKHGYTDCDGVS